VTIDVYGRPECPHCVKAKGYLAGLGISYRYLDVHERPGLKAQLAAAAGYAPDTLPQIFAGPVHIGGCSDLMALPVPVLQQMVGGQ